MKPTEETLRMAKTIGAEIKYDENYYRSALEKLSLEKAQLELEVVKVRAQLELLKEILVDRVRSY